jgi:hypothetical protein
MYGLIKIIKMTPTRFDNLHKYINTGILTLVLTTCVLILTSLNNIRVRQDNIDKEILLLQERQNVNISNISDIGKSLERNRMKIHSFLNSLHLQNLLLQSRLLL